MLSLHLICFLILEKFSKQANVEIICKKGMCLLALSASRANRLGAGQGLPSDLKSRHQSHLGNEYVTTVAESTSSLFCRRRF